MNGWFWNLKHQEKEISFSTKKKRIFVFSSNKNCMPSALHYLWSIDEQHQKKKNWIINMNFFSIPLRKRSTRNLFLVISLFLGEKKIIIEWIETKSSSNTAAIERIENWRTNTNPKKKKYRSKCAPFRQNGIARVLLHRLLRISPTMAHDRKQ